MVWHKLDAAAMRTAALQRVANVAHCFALGTFKTHPLYFLLHDTNSLSERDRLNNKTNAAMACLLTLPTTNPAGALSLTALLKNRNFHKSMIHAALHSPSGMWANLPTNIEVLDPHEKSVQPNSRTTSIIADSKEESVEFIHNNLPQPPHTYVMYCDGANQESGAGAAAANDRGSSLKLRLGDQAHYTSYDGERTSVFLALGLACAAPLNTKFIWIVNENSTVIQDGTDPLSPKSGQHLCRIIAKETHHLL